MVQWLGLGAFTAVGLGSIPGWGTKIPQAMQPKKKKGIKKKSLCELLKVFFVLF